MNAIDIPSTAATPAPASDTRPASALSQIAAQIKRTVIGQDDAIDWLCSFVDAAQTRSRLIASGLGDTLSLPNIGSALLVGPTASGKTHLVKTYAKTTGMVFHSIDASSLSGEGWRGNSLSNEWSIVARKLNDNPAAVALVFIDEVDKLKDDANERGFSPKFELLKPLDGGILEGEDGSHERFALDCDRCVFLFSGAFTGIERHIEARLGIKNPYGFDVVPPEHTERAPEDVRSLITLDDIEAWGFPRELVGRFSTVQFMGALGEDDLVAIVKQVLTPRYESMLLGGRLTIAEEAATLMAQTALTTNYGARSLNQQMNQLLFGPCWQAISEADTGMDAHLDVEDGAVACTLTPAARSLDAATATVIAGDDRNASGNGGTAQPTAPAAQPAAPAAETRPAAATQPATNSTQPAAPAAYPTATRPPDCAFELLDAVARCDPERAAAIDPRKTLSNDYSAYAASLLRDVADESSTTTHPSPVGPYSPAEVTLLHSFLAFLREWFPAADFVPHSLLVLISMADLVRTDKSPLDLLYEELSTGKTAKKRTAPATGVNGSGDGTGSAEGSGEPRAYLEWVPCKLVRNRDRLRPADEGGLKPGQDEALDWYTAFKSFPREKQADAIKTLALRLMPIATAAQK